MKKKKRRLNIKRIVVVIFLIIIIVLGGLYLFNKKAKTKATEIKAVSTIKAYGYTLNDNATAYYKDLFKQLDQALNAKKVNDQKYAQLVSQMFVADFFNLDNKTSKNDVGGKQFVYTPYQSDFEKYAMNSIYKTVQNNIYGNRQQTLPIVTKVTVKKIKTEAFKYSAGTDTNAYVYNFKIEYKKDLGYQTKGSLVLIHNDKKIEVASMSEKSSTE
jgi:hypothetical protein